MSASLGLGRVSAGQGESHGSNVNGPGTKPAGSASLDATADPAAPYGATMAIRHYARVAIAGNNHLLVQPLGISRSGPSPYSRERQRLRLLPPRRYLHTAVPPS